MHGDAVLVLSIAKFVALTAFLLHCSISAVIHVSRYYSNNDSTLSSHTSASSSLLRRRLSSSPRNLSSFNDPKSVVLKPNEYGSTQSVVETGNAEPFDFVADPGTGNDDPSEWAYLFVHYHKTGNKISTGLKKLIPSAFDLLTPGGRLPQRRHDARTNCPSNLDIHMPVGAISVATGPNFFCDVRILVQALLFSATHFNKKVKIIHLVRNPFQLAVSNYNYHRQDPTPEDWVFEINPCGETAMLPSLDLLRPTFFNSGVMEEPIMYDEDFAILQKICHELYQSQPETASWNFYDHLRNLPPTQGLNLATMQMVGEMLRMANNIIKFNQLKQLDLQGRIQVRTISMSDFQNYPEETMFKLLSFMSLPPGRKERISHQYGEWMNRVKEEKTNNHVTTGNSNEEMLNDWLRGDEFWGRILGNIEKVVDAALMQQQLDS